MKQGYRIKGHVLAIYDHTGRERYSIDLKRLTDSASLLDFIYQVKHKSWCTPEILYALIDGFDSACGKFLDTTVQGAFCSGGEELNRGGFKLANFRRADEK